MTYLKYPGIETGDRRKNSCCSLQQLYHTSSAHPQLSLIFAVQKKIDFNMIPAILRLKSGGSSKVKHRASGQQKNLKSNCSRDAENRGISRQVEAAFSLRHSQTRHSGTLRHIPLHKMSTFAFWKLVLFFRAEPW